MKHIINFLVILVISLTSYPPFAFSHCQMPCGIYDDNARIKYMLEDLATMKKAVKIISDLSGKMDAQSVNKIVRWISNKEKHSQNVISTICDYFLTQRIKSDEINYVDKLKKHHAVIVAAMMVKQNVDMKYIDALEASIKELMPYYSEQNSLQPPQHPERGPSS